MNQEEEPCHLFILVHGLWGGPNHMLTIEKCLKELLVKKSNKKVVILRPSSFRFWKTYDGLKICAERVLLDMFYEIETLKQKNNYKVDSISIVGYSLGGLISRYLIGILEEIQFFQHVEPVFFTTFATPHVGIEFFNNNVFDKIANSMGPYLFGKSGRELFLSDTDKLLLDMADPESFFFKGLQRFQKHILLANVKNDRSVAFYTSFITEYSPFDKFNDINIKYLKNLPQSRIGKVFVRGKFVDLIRSNFNPPSGGGRENFQEETSILRSNRIYKYSIILFGSLIFFPIWIPVILSVSLMTSIYSMVKIRILSYPEYDGHWKRVKQSVYGNLPVSNEDYKIGTKRRNQRKNLQTHDTFKGDTSEITENVMEGMLYAEERFTGKSPKIHADEHGDNDLNLMLDSDNLNLSNNSYDESSSSSNEQEVDQSDQDRLPPLSKAANKINLIFKEKKKVLDIDPVLNDEAIRDHLPELSNPNESKFPLFIKKNRLPVNEIKQKIINNLNLLNWIKIPIYIDAWNAHDGIVARRGPITNPKGTASISLWISILRDHLENTQTSTS